MIRLTNSSTDLLSLITAQNGAKVVVSYSDATSSAYAPRAKQAVEEK